MATQIVMDHSGDTRHHFDATDREAVAKAEERFLQLTGAGFTAAVRTASGDAAVTRSFDPTAEETLFFPARRRLVLAMSARSLLMASRRLGASLAHYIREVQAARERYRARFPTRKQRGINLLREWLSPEQRAQFDAKRYFDVIGCDSGKRYRIRYGDTTNVQEFGGNNASLGRLVLPTGGAISCGRRDACSKNRS